MKTGQWMCYNINWSSDQTFTRIRFKQVKGKNRFSIGGSWDVFQNEELENQVQASGSWDICDRDNNFALLLIFDNNKTSFVELNWVESFDWGSDILFKHTLHGVEPVNTLKAKSNNDYFIWRAKEDADLTDDRPSGDELNAYQSGVTKAMANRQESFDDSSISEVESRLLLQSKIAAGHNMNQSGEKSQINQKKKYTSRRNKILTSIGYDENHVKNSEHLLKATTMRGSHSFEPYEQFNDYRKQFEDLVQLNTVKTADPIVFMMLNLRSTRVLGILKIKEYEYQVRAWDLNSTKEVYRKSYGGPGSYIKMSIIDQNATGDRYCVSYFDDGKFFLSVFDDKREISNVCLNKPLGLSEGTLPNENFYDPYSVSCFITNEEIFAAVYHQPDLMHHHCYWDLGLKQITQHVSFGGNAQGFYSPRNFPQRAFYDPKVQQIHIFYRQGQCIACERSDLNQYKKQLGLASGIGQMVLFKGEIVIARINQSIVFYKKSVEEEGLDFEQNWEWKEYYRIATGSAGFITYTKGNRRIQICDLEQVYFFQFDEDFMPVLDGVMKNFMKATQVVIGAKVRYAICYKGNENDFELYRRKYHHNMRSTLNDSSFDGAVALELPENQQMVVGLGSRLLFFNSLTFEQDEVYDLPFKNPNDKVMGICLSADHKSLYLVFGEQRLGYKVIGGVLKYALETMFVESVVDAQYSQKLTQVCDQFHEIKPNTLLMANFSCIFQFGFDSGDVDVLSFSEKLEFQPHTFLCVGEDLYLVMTNKRGLLCNAATGEETHLHTLYAIDSLKAAIYDEEDDMIYLVANKQKRYGEMLLGFYLMKFRPRNPRNVMILTEWRHKLDIGDVFLKIVLGNDPSSGNYKELVIGYKTIFMNTYTVHVEDLSGPEAARRILFRHEGFHLWEQDCTALVIGSDYFVQLAPSGLKVLIIGSKERGEFEDTNGERHVIHSLESFSYLKLDPDNFLFYDCETPNQRKIRIMYEWDKPVQYSAEQKISESQFDTIYSIKLYEPTLRELLQLQSYYYGCRNHQNIQELAERQPTPRTFFMALLELNCNNLLQIMASDAETVRLMLSERNISYYLNQMVPQGNLPHDFPLMYKWKVRCGKKQYAVSPIDFALKTDQMSSIQAMISYIVRHQNFYTSSFLFEYNFPTLCRRDIDIYPLLLSDVFNFHIDYDPWPALHDNAAGDVQRGYNGSLFELRLRHAYRELFEEEDFAPIDIQSTSKRVHRITYTANLLPQFFSSVHEVGDPSLMSFFRDGGVTVAGNPKMDYFKTDAIIQILNFRWARGALRLQLVDMYVQIMFWAILGDYIIWVYLGPEVIYSIVGQTRHGFHQYLGAIGLVTFSQMIFEIAQIVVLGPLEFFSIWQNYIDLLKIIACYVHIDLAEMYGPHKFSSRFFLILTVICSGVQLYLSLRVIPSAAPVVAMFKKSIFDLRYILAFMVFTSYIFSLMLGVINFCNSKKDGLFKEEFGEVTDILEVIDDGMPMIEYWWLNRAWAYFLSLIRMSIGDTDWLEGSTYMDLYEQRVFWILFVISVLLLFIILLNFVVAKAMESHAESVETELETLQLERSQLIDDTECLIPTRYKTKRSYPRYIINRTLPVLKVGVE